MNETWDDEVTLIKKKFKSGTAGVRVEDDEDEESVMAKQVPVHSAEFYRAGQNGIEISKMFVIHSFEYGGQVELIFEGERYKIIKTYPVAFDELELSCEKKVGRKNEH